MSNRRKFIKQLLTGTAGIIAVPAWAKNSDSVKITILHTNDLHSRIEPFPKNDPKYANLGGFARIGKLVDQIREQEPNVILLDAGDVFQGTPYFNLFGGQVEFELMSRMNYDASTIGNHDLDNGIDGLVDKLPYATFPFINCNYDVSDTRLEAHIKPYKIIDKQGVRIGILGVGIELQGLVDINNYGNIVYKNPIENANRVAKMLKTEKKCDVIICLSHLGYKYSEPEKVSDVIFAAQSKNIDIIIGGHTHTFLEEPVIAKNVDNQKVVINQVGWAGINLGRIDILVNKIDGNTGIAGTNLIVKTLV